MRVFPRPPIEVALEELPSRIIESEVGRFLWEQFWKSEDPSHAAFVYRSYRDAESVEFPGEDLKIMRDLVIKLMRSENAKSRNPVVEGRTGINIPSSGEPIR
jgi:hypothetical protein